MCTIICIIWLKVDEDGQFHAISVIHRGHILHYPIVRKHFYQIQGYSFSCIRVRKIPSYLRIFLLLICLR